MGLLDSVIGALGQGSAGGQGDLLQAVMGLLANDGAGQIGPGGLGGLGGLLAKAQQGGLGDIVQSWIGQGQNLPISADQLQALLGNDTLATLARQLGLAPGAAAGSLSELLPQVVDRLTPQGQLPQGGLGPAADLLAGFLRR